ncbi:MAG: PilZ domain-containing protein [Candidatus Omnitrophica bacterium]|nr:PilZ domain-containing protein [Candidatus Omnitrophota bacterium]
MTATAVTERRKSARQAPPSRFTVHLLQANGATATEGVNVSEGGLCLRLREMLEVRSLVQLQVTPGDGGKGRRPVRCAGRVTWVMQRLDLRGTPPFVFDTGIEFVNPPPGLRQRVIPAGAGPVTPGRTTRSLRLGPAVIRGREYVPRIERSPGSPARWHLVILAEGVPCLSEHYPSERAALAAWTRFRRQRAKR